MVGLNHVFIKSNNLDNTFKFFKDVLEMNIFYSSWDDKILILDCGASYIGFIEKHSKTDHPAGGPCHIAISFEKITHEKLIQKIQSNHSHLKTRGPVEFDDAIRNLGNFKAFFVNDPDNNEIELMCIENQ
ncbi:MAG: hypothetical protein COA79_14510 [Planctomycetota bacterium]|nr:MAG: hypothetical protein COA79_14510 [Planctomycetota bacterium]